MLQFFLSTSIMKVWHARQFYSAETIVHRDWPKIYYCSLKCIVLYVHRDWSKIYYCTQDWPKMYSFICTQRLV